MQIVWEIILHVEKPKETLLKSFRRKEVNLSLQDEQTLYKNQLYILKTRKYLSYIQSYEIGVILVTCAYNLHASDLK
jgi:hypothetical protein